MSFALPMERAIDNISVRRPELTNALRTVGTALSDSYLETSDEALLGFVESMAEDQAIHELRLSLLPQNDDIDSAISIGNQLYAKWDFEAPLADELAKIADGLIEKGFDSYTAAEAILELEINVSESYSGASSAPSADEDLAEIVYTATEFASLKRSLEVSKSREFKVGAKALRQLGRTNRRSSSFQELQLAEKRNDLVKDTIGRGSLTLLAAAPNVGKTALLAELSVAVARGYSFFGRKTSQGGVIFIATEGLTSAKKRFLAQRTAKNIEEDLPIDIALSGIDLASQDAETELLALIRDSSFWLDSAPVLIVIDTLSAATPGSDENSASDVTKVIAKINRVRELTGVAFILSHHTGKNADKGPRGSSVLTAAADTILVIDRDEETGVRTVKASKQRDYEIGAPFHFSIAPVVIGKDDEGDITAAITTPAVFGTHNISDPAPESGEGRALATLRELVELTKQESSVSNSETDPTALLDGPTIPIERWRHKFVATYYPNAGRSTASSAFNRASKNLYASNRVIKKGDYVRIQD